MERRTVTLESGARSFRLVAFDLDPHEDAAYIKRVLRGVAAHGGVALAPSGKMRSEETLNKTRYLGVLSEHLLRDHLRDVLAPARVENPQFTTHDAHVDLTVAGAREVQIEVRGSFPYSKLNHVIFNIFDVIGPYTTDYKHVAVPKDFYLRTLINEAAEGFSPRAPHTLYFAGGASHDLFEEIGTTGSFKQRGAHYLRIKPIADARDAVEVVDEIRRAATGAPRQEP